MNSHPEHGSGPGALVELAKLDLRYEGCRLKSPVAEVRLLAAIDEFITALRGKKLSARQIEHLAHGFFRGPEYFRQEIRKGHLTLPLQQLKDLPDDPDGCSQFERLFLAPLPRHLPAPYLLLERTVDEYGYVAVEANYYEVPGCGRGKIQVLRYLHHLVLCQDRRTLIEYALPPWGVKNQPFHAPGQKPRHRPRNRKLSSQEEEKRLRAIDRVIGAYVDFILGTPGLLRHQFLRLPGLLARWDEHLNTAAQSNLSHARFLTRVIQEEYRLKCEQARQQRLKLARIPDKWVMDTFPFERQPKLNKKKILALYDSMAFLRQRQNIIWLGGTGCGKTGLATSFLIQAIHQGARGRYVLFTDLLNELHRSEADLSQNQVIGRYVKYELLLIDEIGYAEAEPSQVGLFFTLLQKRHKQRSTLITSNLGFSEWASFLKNPHLTAALIDRLTESSHLFNMRECVSLRARMAADP